MSLVWEAPGRKIPKGRPRQKNQDPLIKQRAEEETGPVRRNGNETGKTVLFTKKSAKKRE